VHTAPIISGFMPIHETGGIRNPHAGGSGRDRGRALALPGEDLRRRNYRTKTGRVRKRWKPGELLKYYNEGNRGRAQARSGRGGRRRAFITKTKGGVPVVLRRRGRARYPLERLYVFTPRAAIKPTWKFEPTVKKFAQFAFRPKFNRNMASALK
jgi:hypothetical protein